MAAVIHFADVGQNIDLLQDLEVKMLWLDIFRESSQLDLTFEKIRQVEPKGENQSVI